MDKLRIQEIIAAGRVRNLSDEQIANDIMEYLREVVPYGKRSRSKQVDSVGDSEAGGAEAHGEADGAD